MDQVLFYGCSGVLVIVVLLTLFSLLVIAKRSQSKEWSAEDILNKEG